jgi:mono/diheme cytochrome c family protein
MASLISLRSLAPSLSLFFLFSFAKTGEDLYLRHCASCHGEDRLGRTAPPLIPSLLKSKSDEEMADLITRGIPASGMPGFDLDPESVRSLVEFLRSPLPEVSLSLDRIRATRREIEREPATYEAPNLRDLTVFVDRGRNRVLLFKGSRVIDSFELRNVHGGVKFSREGFYVPTRDGWVLYYSLGERRPKVKVRACVYLRNIALQGDRLAVACVLPRAVVITDRDLRPLKLVKLEGRPSALYPFGDGFILGFRDLPRVAFLSPEGEISYKDVEHPLQDFFIDPFEGYLVGSSRETGEITVYSLPNLKKVASRRTGSMPHLFATAFWYRDGSFFFATRHIRTTKVTLWEMYSWRKVAEVEVGSRGFFVRTHPSSPYLWVDGGEGELILIDKRTYEVSRVRISDGGRVTHVEFSGNGDIAYVSLEGKGLVLLDPQVFRELAFLETPKPSGKYNPLLKTRLGVASLLGFEVFMRKCWGCHHTTRQAFGPPLRWIADHRSRDLIVAQILNPQGTYRLLGYARNSMPRIRMSPQEVEAVLKFMEALRYGWFD